MVPLFEDFDPGMSTPSNTSGMGSPSFGDTIGSQANFNTGTPGSADTWDFGAGKKKTRKKKLKPKTKQLKPQTNILQKIQIQR